MISVLQVWNTKQNGGSLKVEYSVPNHLAESVTSLSWGSTTAEDLQQVRAFFFFSFLLFFFSFFSVKMILKRYFDFL